MRPFAVDVLPAFGQAVPALSAAFAENPGTNNDVLSARINSFFMSLSVDTLNDSANYSSIKFVP